ncbi:MAG TPA: glutathione S-transferase [Alphaproteobacteria bacterium]|nr:glutathione S-transferase [Alphaproteobacteria bacterium]
MKFYDCSTAPSPRRARIFIAEKGVDIPTVEVNLREKEQMTPEFAAINPYLTVPVLELDDGTRLNSTHGVWRYLEETHPDPPLMGRNAREKALVADREWRMEVEGFMAVGEALRNYAKPMADRALTGKHNYAQIPELAERGRARVPRFFEDLDRILGESAYVAGEVYTVADITAFVTVEFAGWLKLGLTDEQTNAKRWYEAVKARPSSAL